MSEVEFYRFYRARGLRGQASCSATAAAAIAVAAVAVAVAMILATPAHAIPSPELVVGTLSSVSQLFTLMAAMLGGGALAAGARATRKGAANGGARMASWLGVGALIALGLSLYGNWHQYSQYNSESRSRLEATLLRPAGTAALPKAAPIPKELTYSQQLKHRRGISTGDTAKAIEAIQRGEAKDTVIIDVREAAETAMGNLPGAIVARYSDFDDLELDLNGKKVVTFCHTGTRSLEICELLAARGIDCRFIVGGLEKWVTEARPMTGLAVRTIETLRAIPAYATQRVLLETPQVHKLVQEESAAFVDVRATPELGAGPLPNAIHLPIRRLTSAEVGRQIAALPRKPLILPCYDRGGCFFAEVLGHELTKAGHDVRGRYTLPWEYFQPAPRPPYVEQWIQEAQAGPWEKSVRATTSVLGSMTVMMGLFGAIFAAALLSRLVVLPFSLKAERDQVVSTALAPEVEDLERRLGNDPVRHSRALGALYKRHRLTPIRNMIALLFVPVLALFSLAVQRVAEAQPTTLLWIDHVGQRDPYLVMPLLAAGLLGIYVHAAFVSTRRHGLIVWLVAVPMLAFSLALLGAAVNVYIAVSAALLLAQRALIGGAAMAGLRASGSSEQRLWRRGLPDGMLPLSAVDRLGGCGNKAYRLAQLKQAGIHVPDGVVLTGKLLAALRAQSEKAKARTLRAAWREVRAKKVAVRSSASAEDGASHSFAGVFESLLDVDRAGFAAAVERVASSFESDKAKSYGSDAGGGNVLVQRMVPAQYAGVMFTVDPAAGGLMLVEMVEGTGDALVSGSKTPTGFRFGRLSGRNADDGGTKPPLDLAPLLAIGHQAEKMFGCPQDIEWAYAKGRFSIVQSRDIVSASTGGDAAMVHAEWARVVDHVAGRPVDETALVQNELTELLPRPTMLSQSLMEAFWSSGGSLDLACSRLGIRYPIEEDSPPYLVGVLGHLYVDRREMTRRSPVVSSLTLRRLRRSADRFERDFRETFLPDFLAEMRLAQAIDFDRLSLADLLAEMERRRASFVERTHVEVDVINVLAQLYVDDARKQLEGVRIDAIAHLAPRQVNEPQRVLQEARVAGSDTRLADLLAGMGHRSAFDYELSRPRYDEDKPALEKLAGLTAAVHAHGPKLKAAPEILEAVDRAQRFQVLKEDAKHHSLRELALLRRIAVALDRRLGNKGLVFHLTFAELGRIDSTQRHRHELLAGERMARQKAFAGQSSPPSTLTPGAIELASTGSKAAAFGSGGLGGTRVSGSAAVMGRARVITPEAAEIGAPIEDFQPGDIIVARMISPSWLPYMRDAGGLVCEIGGWLSHTALVAREYDLVMITGVRGIAAIPDMASIELRQDGTIALQTARRAEMLPRAAE